MRAFNVLVLPFVFMAVTTLGICYVGDLILGDSVKYIALPLALFVGMNARRIVEKCLGYTTKEALAGDSDEE